MALAPAAMPQNPVGLSTQGWSPLLRLVGDVPNCYDKSVLLTQSWRESIGLSGPALAAANVAPPQGRTLVAVSVFVCGCAFAASRSRHRNSVSWRRRTPFVRSAVALIADVDETPPVAAAERTDDVLVGDVTKPLRELVAAFGASTVGEISASSVFDVDSFGSLPRLHRDRLFEIAVWSSCLRQEAWLQDWMELVDKRVQAVQNDNWEQTPTPSRREQDAVWTRWATCVVCYFAEQMHANSRPLSRSELDAFAWTLEFCRPEAVSSPTRDAGEESGELGSARRAFANALTEIKSRSKSVQATMAQSEEDSLSRPRMLARCFNALLAIISDLREAVYSDDELERLDTVPILQCFDASVFVQVHAVMLEGVGLRGLFGTGIGSLAATRATRLARAFASRACLQEDDDFVQEEKVRDVEDFVDQAIAELVACEEALSRVALLQDPGSVVAGSAQAEQFGLGDHDNVADDRTEFLTLGDAQQGSGGEHLHQSERDMEKQPEVCLVDDSQPSLSHIFEMLKEEEENETYNQLPDEFDIEDPEEQVLGKFMEAIGDADELGESQGDSTVDLDDGSPLNAGETFGEYPAPENPWKDVKQGRAPSLEQPTAVSGVEAQENSGTSWRLAPILQRSNELADSKKPTRTKNKKRRKKKRQGDDGGSLLQLKAEAGRAGNKEPPPAENPWPDPGKIADAEIPSVADPWADIRQMSAAGIPPAEDPWAEVRAMGAAGIPPAEDPWENVRDIRAAGSHPADDPVADTRGTIVEGVPAAEDPWADIRAGFPPAEDPWEDMKSSRPDSSTNMPQHADPWADMRSNADLGASASDQPLVSSSPASPAAAADPWADVTSGYEAARRSAFGITDSWAEAERELQLKSELADYAEDEEVDDDLEPLRWDSKAETADATAADSEKFLSRIEELRHFVDRENAEAWAAKAHEAAKVKQEPTDGRLPIEDWRGEILEMVRQQRASIVVGATGCGKSTRVPQFLMDEPGSRVLVTQPRRVAAVEIARRVAAERGEQLGQNVGYRISGESRIGSGKLQFATVGYALAWFLGRPETFASFTHIVLDEVHERGADMEMFLLLVRMLLHIFKGTKIVLMSATVQAEIFSEYFSHFNDASYPNTISVPGRTFPVREIFLDDFVKEKTLWTSHLHGKAASAADAAVTEFESSCDSGGWLVKTPRVLPSLSDLALALIPIFAKKDSTMLVFLPGMAELSDMSDLFSSALQTRKGADASESDAPTSYKIFVMHSMVPQANQQAVFDKPSGGVCNVVLASNIAESSITLPHVVAVLDFGLHREIVHDTSQRLSRLVTTWCSRASVKQRSGRAGRVQPGVAIRLFTRRFFTERLEEFDTPEILRASLSRLYLRVKKLSYVLEAAASRHEGASEFPIDVQSTSALLNLLPQPPDAKLLESAVAELAMVGALSKEDETAEITSLGLFVESLPVDLMLCRLCWLGALWGCAAEAVVMAAACASGDPFSTPTRILSDDGEYVGKLRRSWLSRRQFDGGHFSEPLSWLRLFCFWADRHRSNRSTKSGAQRCNATCRAFAKDVSVIPSKMQQFVLRVADLAERVVQLDMPGSKAVAASARLDLEQLLSLIHEGDGDPNDFFRAEAPLLKLVLAAGLSEQILVGRRFMDQLRGPRQNKKKRDGGPRLPPRRPSTLGSGNEDDPCIDGPDSEDSSAEFSQEVADKKENEQENDDDDAANWGSGEQLGDEQEEQAGDEDGEVEGEEHGDTPSKKDPWLLTRKEMLDAVKSLPLKGLSFRSRVLVARLKDKKNKRGIPGGLSISQVADTMKKFCGRAPLYVKRARGDAKYVAVAFPNDLTLPSLPRTGGALGDAPAPVLSSASTDPSLCYMFGEGRGLVNVEDQIVARPTSPYLMSFFLPERDSDRDESKQRLVSAIFDTRGPIGFPCHTTHSEDFVALAANLQMTESQASVRCSGVTVLPAYQLMYALVTLSPERSALAFQLDREKKGQGSSSDDQFLIGVRVNGWEVKFPSSEAGLMLPATEALDALNRVRASIREALKTDGVVPVSRRLAEGANKPKRRLRGNGGSGEVDSEVAVEDLLTLIEAAQQSIPAAPPPKRKRKGKNRAPWIEAAPAGEGDGFADHLRALEVGDA